MKGMLGRLGGVITSPLQTLMPILQGKGGDALEPVLLAVLTVLATFPQTFTRYLLVARVDVLTSFSRLFNLQSGFVTMRLANEAIFCLGVGAGWWILGRRSQKCRLGDALTAAAYLYVPMAVLVLVGGLLSRAGQNLPWLPHHPLDGWWVFEGNRVHLERFYLKLGVEMVWPAAVALGLAIRLWRVGPPAPGLPVSAPAGPPAAS